MSKTFTTSAQKTLTISKDEILVKLEFEMVRSENLVFKPTTRKYLKEANIGNRGKLIIAAFNKGKGKTLAMIDYKNLPASNSRSAIQTKLRKILDKIFDQVS